MSGKVNFILDSICAKKFGQISNKISYYMYKDSNENLIKVKSIFGQVSMKKMVMQVHYFISYALIVESSYSYIFEIIFF